MNGLTLQVIHPAFQNLKRNGRLLHLVAAGLIASHAIAHFNGPNPNLLYLGCLLLIAADIVILVFAVRNALTELPKVNLFFRVIEIIFIAGIGAEMLMKQQYWMGSLHLMMGIAYIYLLYCERTVAKEERISIHHTGITVPALPASRFYIWSQIKKIDADYSSITVNTSLEKSYRFHLQQNLQFEELDQIHEFCRHYLGAAG